jgi:hypothetical protein
MPESASKLPQVQDIRESKMNVRLTVYQDIFVNVTLTLDEATALMDAAEAFRSVMPSDVVVVADKFQAELEIALKRAQEIQRKKES